MPENSTVSSTTLAVPRVANSALTKTFLIIGLVYLFILSITLLGISIKSLGAEAANTILQITASPLVGLAIGVLATSIIQSSSTTTSIVVGMVGSGTLPLQSAVAIVMGANIGTSVTNILVSLLYIPRKDEFKAAFTGAIVHDLFNVCSVIVLLPLQIHFNLIGRTAELMEHFVGGSGGIHFKSPLKAITMPVAKWVLALAGDNGWVGIVVALLLLFVAMRYIVKVLKSLVLVRVEKFFQKYIFRNAALGFLLGIALTMTVQSSSITTSLVVPLVGAGVLRISQVYPYVLGANIGTTITAFLAAIATGVHSAVAVAFAHLTFNLYGMAVFWPLKRIPIGLSEWLSSLVHRSRLIPLVYIVTVFFIVPAIIIWIGA